MYIENTLRQNSVLNTNDENFINSYTLEKACEILYCKGEALSCSYSVDCRALVED